MEYPIVSRRRPFTSTQENTIQQILENPFVKRFLLEGEPNQTLLELLDLMGIDNIMKLLINSEIPFLSNVNTLLDVLNLIKPLMKAYYNSHRINDQKTQNILTQITNTISLIESNPELSETTLEHFNFIDFIYYLRQYNVQNLFNNEIGISNAEKLEYFRKSIKQLPLDSFLDNQDGMPVSMKFMAERLAIDFMTEIIKSRNNEFLNLLIMPGLDSFYEIIKKIDKDRFISYLISTIPSNHSSTLENTYIKNITTLLNLFNTTQMSEEEEKALTAAIDCINTIEKFKAERLLLTSLAPDGFFRLLYLMQSNGILAKKNSSDILAKKNSNNLLPLFIDCIEPLRNNDLSGFAYYDPSNFGFNEADTKKFFEFIACISAEYNLEGIIKYIITNKSEIFNDTNFLKQILYHYILRSSLHIEDASIISDFIDIIPKKIPLTKEMLQIAARYHRSNLIKWIIDNFDLDQTIVKDTTDYIVQLGYCKLLNHLAEYNEEFDDYKNNSVNRLLYLAADRGCLDAVKYLITNRANHLITNRVNPNIQNNLGWAPLHLAAVKGYLPIVQILIANRADVNIQNNFGCSPLHLACITGHSTIIQYLIAKGADVNIKNNNGETPLFVAAERGHLAIIQYLVEKGGANINTISKKRQTPLYIAYMKKHLDIIKFLIGNGANVNIQNDDGETLLYIAIREEESEIVQILIANRANPNIQNNFGWAPLHMACIRGDLIIVRFLIENYSNTDVNIQNKNGQTPLFVAAEIGYLEIVQYLISKGANPNIPDKQGQTPLYNAAVIGYLPIVRYLIANGANLDIQNNDGKTPLFVAAEIGYLEIVQYLVEKGANIDTVDEQGRTPLYIVCMTRHLDVIEFLIKNGANPYLEDKYGRSPYSMLISFPEKYCMSKAEKRKNREIITQIEYKTQQELPKQKFFNTSDDSLPKISNNNPHNVEYSPFLKLTSSDSSDYSSSESEVSHRHIHDSSYDSSYDSSDDSSSESEESLSNNLSSASENFSEGEQEQTHGL